MIRRQYFGWLSSKGEYRLSLSPPDAPVRPSIAFDSEDEVMAYARRKRAEVLWLPPLPGKEAAAA